jgi:hypothetical protein
MSGGGIGVLGLEAEGKAEKSGVALINHMGVTDIAYRGIRKRVE